MSRLPSEVPGGAGLRDQYGRRELLVKNLNDPLGATDVRGAGSVFDVDGREHVVLVNLSGGIGAPNVVTTNYTLLSTDASAVVETNSASAIVITVPPAVFAIGDVIEVCRIGAGALTVSPGVGVTLRSQSGALGVAHQYSSASLRCRASNDFVVVGDLA